MSNRIIEINSPLITCEKKNCTNNQWILMLLSGEWELKKICKECAITAAELLFYWAEIDEILDL